jgi:Sulfatase-modifying factor enzyme 1
MANTWQGGFPWQNSLLDGWLRTSPVGAFPANGYGLADMAGNVWEWTADWFVPRHRGDPVKACCTPENPRGGRAEESLDPSQPAVRIPRKVVTGGSHSLLSQLLPALPAGGALPRDDRYGDQSHRLSLRRAGVGGPTKSEPGMGSGAGHSSTAKPSAFISRSDLPFSFRPSIGRPSSCL